MSPVPCVEMCTNLDRSDASLAPKSAAAAGIARGTVRSTSSDTSARGARRSSRQILRVRSGCAAGACVRRSKSMMYVRAPMATWHGASTLLSRAETNRRYAVSTCRPSAVEYVDHLATEPCRPERQSQRTCTALSAPTAHHPCPPDQPCLPPSPQLPFLAAVPEEKKL